MKTYVYIVAPLFMNLIYPMALGNMLHSSLCGAIFCRLMEQIKFLSQGTSSVRLEHEGGKCIS